MLLPKVSTNFSSDQSIDGLVIEEIQIGVEIAARMIDSPQTKASTSSMKSTSTSACSSRSSGRSKHKDGVIDIILPNFGILILTYRISLNRT